MSFVILGNGGSLESAVNYSEAIENFFLKKGFSKRKTKSINLDYSRFIDIIFSYSDISEDFGGRTKPLKNLGRDFSEEGVNIKLISDVYSHLNEEFYQAVLNTAKVYSDGKGNRPQSLELSINGYCSFGDLHFPGTSSKKAFYEDFKSTLENKFSNNGSSEPSIKIF